MGSPRTEITGGYEAPSICAENYLALYSPIKIFKKIFLPPFFKHFVFSFFWHLVLRKAPSHLELPQQRRSNTKHITQQLINYFDIHINREN